MLNKGIETVTGVLETVVTKVESFDESAQKREVFFGQASHEKKAVEESKEKSDAASGEVAIQGQSD
jgi:hypothetical protein